jgi:hypothetical protein
MLVKESLTMVDQNIFEIIQLEELQTGSLNIAFRQ